MLQPCIRKAGKISVVVVKDFLSGNDCWQLNKEAAIANIDMKRIERLRMIQSVWPDMALAQRARTQIHKAVLQRSRTEATRIHGGVRRYRFDWDHRNGLRRSSNLIHGQRKPRMARLRSITVERPEMNLILRICTVQGSRFEV